ncbi:MAG: lactate racemase domain-containing protein, partial [Candidatus Latescibacteria bacterium]|nr:lactate racemase domain-containing protein [Candidatus Latescibacterota bacterium]
MSSVSVTIPIACWRDNTTLDLDMPDEWQVTECIMAGHDAPEMTDDKIKESFAHPLGTPTLREMAGGKQQVAILFDDLIRPTPAYRVVPFVIDELHQAGIADDQIRFIAAIGTHAPMTRAEMVKKLGAEI